MDVWLSIGFVWAFTFVLGFTLFPDEVPKSHLFIISGIASLILIAWCVVGIIVRAVI